MEILQWLVYPCLAYLALSSFKQDKTLAVLQTTITSGMTMMKQDIDDLKNDVVLLNGRIDVFLKKEIESFTDIVERNTKALNRWSDSK